jgi:8-oxo-dGTP pyrophosphatase MutT (NUDIX family)
MAQKYKVYFQNRPVYFAQSVPPEVECLKYEAFRSKGTHDTGLIETAIARGARAVVVLSDDVEKSWNDFTDQFEFVQAAGGLLVRPSGQMLFIFRHERWDLPKGKVEDDENLEQGAVREVEEECSLHGSRIIAPLDSTWHTYIQQGIPVLKCTAWYIMLYEGNETPLPQAIEGITEARWFDADQLDTVRRNTYPSVIDVVENYFVSPSRISVPDRDAAV